MHNIIETSYRVFPANTYIDEPDLADHFTLDVVLRGEYWAITWGGEVWNKINKQWEYDSVTSKRYGDDLVNVRYGSSRQAFEDAVKIVDELSVNGWTWAAWRKHKRESETFNG